MHDQSRDECTPVTERVFGFPDDATVAVRPTTAGAIADDSTDSTDIDRE